MNMETISVNRLRIFRRCARLHHYRYGLGYETVAVDEALRFGKLWHDGQEAWWLSRGDLDAALAAMRVPGVDPFDLARAEALFEGYHHRWGGAGFEVLAVEAEFVAPLINPATGAPSKTYQLVGRIDLIVREIATGRVLIGEHKTSSEDIGVGSTYWARLRMDSQVSTYFAGAAALGFDAAACLYDVIGKPALRPLKKSAEIKLKKDGTPYANCRLADETPAEYGDRIRLAIAEAPEKFYQRGEVVRLEDELADHAFDIWQTARIIRESEIAGRRPKNPEACIRYGKTCSFFDVCSGTASLDDAARFRRIATAAEKAA